MTTITAKPPVEVFRDKLEVFKKTIDKDIETYAKHVQANTLQQYGKEARVEVDTFLSILSRGGKRLRGALVMLGYEMSGGKNKKMIVQAARAIEMLHAYILIIDDIQDRSLMRRGAPTAHIMLADYHDKHELGGDEKHFGIAMALNSAVAGCHAAEMILANLDVDEHLRMKVVSIVNRTMLITAHGQTHDIMNEVSAEVDQAAVERVMTWKTAHYTLLNPLHVGMVLAGAECSETDAITEFANEAGLAFQITDDILGVFGTEIDSGKSPMDDIREGKRTLLIIHALKHATSGNKNFLIQMLGNEDITPVQFNRCKDIIVESGALDFAKAESLRHVTAASKALAKEAPRWAGEGIQFLHGLSEYLLTRSS